MFVSSRGLFSAVKTHSLSIKNAVFNTTSNNLGALSQNRTFLLLSSQISSPAIKSVVYPSANNNITPMNKSQIRFASSTLRPRRVQYRKAFKGFFKSRTGGTLRGTRVYHGEYGLQAAEGGRITDKQFDAVKSAIRLILKAEKGSKLILRAFPDRPVTSKGAEVRMGKGKGAVDYYATWVSKDRIIFEVKGLRKESARNAFRIATAALPLKTRFVELNQFKVAPRLLPYFIRRNANATERLAAIIKSKLQSIIN